MAFWGQKGKIRSGPARSKRGSVHVQPRIQIMNLLIIIFGSQLCEYVRRNAHDGKHGKYHEDAALSSL